MGEKNNNEKMEITYQRAMKAGSVESMEVRDFVVRKGSRAEVDARFTGCLTSLSEVITEERAKALGKRIDLPTVAVETATE